MMIMRQRERNEQLCASSQQTSVFDARLIADFFSFCYIRVERRRRRQLIDF